MWVRFSQMSHYCDLTSVTCLKLIFRQYVFEPKWKPGFRKLIFKSQSLLIILSKRFCFVLHLMLNFIKKLVRIFPANSHEFLKKKEKSNEKKSCKNNANSNINKFYIETCFKFKNLLLFCSKLAIPKTGWPLALRK